MTEITDLSITHLLGNTAPSTHDCSMYIWIAIQYGIIMRWTTEFVTKEFAPKKKVSPENLHIFQRD